MAVAVREDADEEEVVLSVLFEPSLLLQEMTVKLKRDMRIMDKTLFIFSLIPKEY